MNTTFITDLKEVNGYGLSATDITDPSTEVWLVRMKLKAWNNVTGFHAVIYRKHKTGVDRFVFPFGNLLNGDIVNKKHFPAGEAIRWKDDFNVPDPGCPNAEKAKVLLRAMLSDKKLFGYWDYLSPITPTVRGALNWSLWKGKNTPPQFVTTRTTDPVELLFRCESIIRAIDNCDGDVPYRGDLRVMTNYFAHKIPNLTTKGQERLCGFVNQIGGAWMRTGSPLAIGGILKSYHWPTLLEGTPEHRLEHFVARTNVLGASGLQSRSNFNQTRTTRAELKRTGPVKTRKPRPKTTFVDAPESLASTDSAETVRPSAGKTVMDVPSIKLEDHEILDEDPFSGPSTSSDLRFQDPQPISPSSVRSFSFGDGINHWMNRTAKAAKNKRKKMKKQGASWWTLAAERVRKFYVAEAKVMTNTDWSDESIKDTTWGETLVLIPMVPLMAIGMTWRRFKIRTETHGDSYLSRIGSLVIAPFNLAFGLVDGFAWRFWTIGKKISFFWRK